MSKSLLEHSDWTVPCNLNPKTEVQELNKLLGLQLRILQQRFEDGQNLVGLGFGSAESGLFVDLEFIGCRFHDVGLRDFG